MLAASVLAAAPAGSQTISDDNDPMINAGFLSVPQVEGRGYTLSASTMTRYDSNFLRSGASGGAFRVSPLVTAGIGMPLAGQQFFIGGNIGRDIFLNNSLFNANRFAVGGGVGFNVGTRCGGTLGAEIRERQNLLDDVLELQNDILRRTTAGVTVQCSSSSGLGFGATAVWGSQDNSRVQRQLFNNKSFLFSPQISYNSPAFGSIFVGADFNRFRYVNRLLLTPDGVQEDSLDVKTIRAGLSRSIGDRFNLSLGGSYIIADPKPGEFLVPGPVPGQLLLTGREGFRGFGYNGALSMKLGRRMNLNGLLSRQVNGGGNIGAVLQAVNTVGLDVSYRLNDKITLGAGIISRNRNLRGSFSSADEPVARQNDKTRRIFGQLSYDLNRRIGVSAEVSHRRRTTDPAIFNFSNTSMLLRMSLSLGKS